MADILTAFRMTPAILITRLVILVTISGMATGGVFIDRAQSESSWGPKWTSDLDNLYRRVINASHRLQELRQTGAPDVVLHNEERALRQAINALLMEDEIVQLIDHVGSNAFINAFSYIAGAAIRVPVETTVTALRAA